MIGIKGLRAHMGEAIEAVEKYSVDVDAKSIQLYHHNDADGLTSACILSTVFEKAGFVIEKRAALEKPYPHILKSIVADQEKKVIVFTDFCGRIADRISDLNSGKNLVLILDHHVASRPTDSMVYNLDCDLFGLQGDLDMTASVVCHVFAQEMMKYYSIEDAVELEKDLSVLALVGAVGDGFYDSEGHLAGISAEAFAFAEKHGLCSFKSEYVNEKGESMAEIAASLDVLGGIGISEGGPALAIDFLRKNARHCSISADDALLKKIEEFSNFKKTAFEDARAMGLKPLPDAPDVLFVDVKDSFGTMGVKMIGVFLTELSKLPEYTDKFLIGSQNLPQLIPGFENVSPGNAPQVKISGRVGQKLGEKIRKGRAMPLDILLPNASRLVSGFSDACHPTAAAVVISAKHLTQFCDAMARILAGGLRIGVGAGFGKTILCGGDCGFLMWGVNGLVGALPFESVCIIEPLHSGSEKQANEHGFILDDKRVEVPGYKDAKIHQSIAAIDMMLSHLHLSDKVKEEGQGIRVTFRGSLKAASGNGSSAAYSVSFARAANYAYNLGLDDYAINHTGWIGEHAFHGKPSGVDNTVSTFGGLIDISFNVATQKSKFESVKAEPTQIVLAHSGVTADTSSLLGICRQKRESNQSIFDGQIAQITSDVAAMRAAFEKSDWPELGRLMCQNHETIKEMGLSHERVIELCEIGLKAGALGAKVTGGGLGGYVLFLTPGELQENVQKAMEDAKAEAIMAVTWPNPSPVD